MHAILTSEKNVAVYTHWVAARGARSMPRREDIAPELIRHELPYVYMSDVMSDADGIWFRFRLMGTALVTRFKKDGTGKALLDLQIGGWETEWRRNLLFCTKIRMPIVDEATIKTPYNLNLTIEHIALPLSEDDDTVSKVFGAIDFFDADDEALHKILPKINWNDLKDVELAKRIIISNLKLAI
jgi:hypothetical protein